MKTTFPFFVASLSLIFAALPFKVAGADSESPVLFVPASKATLHIAVDLPEKIHERGLAVGRSRKAWKSARCSSGCEIACDGTVQRDGGRIVVDIPPAGDAAKTRRFRLQSSPRQARAAQPRSHFRTTVPRRCESANGTIRCWSTTMA